MDSACLHYQLTDDERTKFERNGYFIVEDAIPSEMVTDLTGVADRLDAHYRAERGLGPHDALNLLDFLGKDEAFLPLLDWPKTFAKVWGILGWNIQLYHTHMIITPPKPPEQEPVKRMLGWHQDSGRLNVELETEPQPRVSLKVAYFLTDTSEVGRANLYVLPGSHLRNSLHPSNGSTNGTGNGMEPAGATAVCAKPGDAVFFDRRIWHASSPNTSQVPRKVLFYGYSYRWLRPRDDMTVAHYMERCDPIQQQLLGASPNGGFGYTSPRDEDVPLRTWLREHLGEAVVAR